MNAITLRRANLTDATELGALHVASWHETYTGLVPSQVLAGVSVEARSVMWSKVVSNPDESGCVAVFVAECGGQLVGFGSCGRQRDSWFSGAGYSGEIGAIYVLRSHQGQGIGRSIMAAMSQALTGAGYEAASLWVLRENRPARAFYERLGGSIVGEKANVQSGATLVEIAYGWHDLSGLVS